MKVEYIKNPSEIIPALLKLAPKGAHFTNGTYAFSAPLIVPTTLAGFMRVSQVYPHLPLVIAVNSDESMRAMRKTNFEPQNLRAAKVAEPLAQLFPNHQVIVIYYDEPTPNALYESLKAKNLTRTLHKWGYGTSPTAPKIEGAECFELVYGFPLPNDIKPVCFDETKVAEKPQKIIVDDLRGKYICETGILLELPEGLKEYQAKEVMDSRLKKASV